MKDIKVKIKVDTGDADKSVEGLDNKIDHLGKTTDKATESQRKMESSTKKTTSAQDAGKKATQGNTTAMSSLDRATGGAIGSLKAMGKQMWLLVANPIGLVIAAISLALTGLYKAFTSTKAGGEKFDQVMAGISATMDVVRDRVLIVGDALVKFFKGDFKGAMDAGKKAVSGFGAEVAKEFQQAADAKKDLQEVANAMRDLSVSRAKLDRDLVKAKETIESSTATYAEKKKAIDEVREAETKQTESELAAAQKKLDAIREQNSLSDSGDEDLEAEVAAEIALINLQKLSSQNKTKFAKLEEMADRDEQARIKETQKVNTEAAEQKKKEDEAEKKRRDDEVQDAKDKLTRIQQIKDEYFLKGLEREIQEIQRKTDADIAELEALGAHKSLIEQIEQDSADKIASITKGHTADRVDTGTAEDTEDKKIEYS